MVLIKTFNPLHLKILSFRYFVIIFLWKRTWPFISTNLNSLHQKDALCQVWLKLTLWFWIERKRLCIFAFCNHLPLVNGVALYLNKIEFPSPKHALCQVWLNLAHLSWRRRCSNFVNGFLLFRNLSPLGIGHGSLFVQT